MVDSDDALLTLIAEGDQAAFRVFSGRHSQRLFALAYRLLGGRRDMAEDVVQDVLIKLWQKAPTWRAGGSVAGYLSRLVYTGCIDVFRRERRLTELPDEIMGSENIVQGLVAAEEQDRLLAAVHALPLHQREVVLLYYFDELSQNEIALRLGRSEKSIERLMARARLKLKEILAPETKKGRIAS